MAENIGFAQSPGCDISTVERQNSPQFELFAHFTSLTQNENTECATSESADASNDGREHQLEKSSSAGFSIETHHAVEVKQEPTEPDSECEDYLPVDFQDKTVAADDSDHGNGVPIESQDRFLAVTDSDRGNDMPPELQDRVFAASDSHRGNDMPPELQDEVFAASDSDRGNDMPPELQDRDVVASDSDRGNYMPPELQDRALPAGDSDAVTADDSYVESDVSVKFHDRDLIGNYSACDSVLPVQFQNKAFAAVNYPAPVYTYSDDPEDSVDSASASTWIEFNENESDDKNDQEWTASDYQIETEDDDFEIPSDGDNDDYGESDDSDFKPGKKKRKSKAATPSKGRGVKKRKIERKRESYQEKINKLKRSIGQLDYMKDVNSTRPKPSSTAHQSRDVGSLQHLLVKGQSGLTKSLLVKKLQQNVEDVRKNQRNMRSVIEIILRQRNLLPTCFQDYTSDAAISSFANILFSRDQDKMPMSSDQPESQTDQTASQLLQSLSDSIQQNVEQTIREQVLEVSDSHATSSRINKKLDGLSGRSSLLLQHLLVKGDEKKPAVDKVTPSSSSLLRAAQDLQASGVSVLRSMLTAKAYVEPTQRSTPEVRATLLRQMLEEEPAPLLPYRMMNDVSHIRHSYVKDSLNNEHQSVETFDDYQVYVDRASSSGEEEDAVKSPDADSDNLKGSECTDVSPMTPVNIKTEPVSDDDEVRTSVPEIKIKSEPLSPEENNEVDTREMSPTDVPHATEEHQETCVKVKQEPVSLSSVGQQHWEMKVSVENQTDPCSSQVSTSSREPKNNKEHQEMQHEPERIKIKSEPLSPTCGKSFAYDQSPQGDNPVALQNMTKRTVKDNTDSNLRTLLDDGNNVSLHNTLMSAGRGHIQGRQSPLESLQSKPGRPCFRRTLTEKIDTLKRQLISGDLDSPVGEGPSSKVFISASDHLKSLSSSSSSSPKDTSASDHLKSISRSSSSFSSHKETILRGLMDRSSTSVLGLDSPDHSHSYNTRRKKKQEDTTLLEKALKSIRPTFQQMRNQTSMDDYLKEASPGRTIPLSLGHHDGGKTENEASATVKKEPDSNIGTDFTQNIASCSQQLLNIIRNVGASPQTGNQEKSVTILKSMLNNDNVGRTAMGISPQTPKHTPEPSATYPNLAKSHRILLQGNSSTNSSPPNVIGQRSQTFLGHGLESKSPSQNQSPFLVKNASLLQSRMKSVRSVSSTSSLKLESVSASNPKIHGMPSRTSDNLSSPVGHHDGAALSLRECPYQCRLCGSAFRSTSLLEEHMQIHFGALPFGCSLCSKSFMTGKELEEHMHIHKNNLAPAPALVFKCTVCGGVFDTEIQHDKHRMLAHGETAFRCSECDRLFGTEELRDAHLRTHQYKAKQCEVCGLYFGNESKYLLHKKMHQNQNKGHPCEYCGELFHVHSKYIRHLSQHTGLKEYMCDKCDKGFVSRNGMMGHIAKCQGRLYQCTGCDESFIRKMELSSHIQNVHGHPGVKCLHCRKMFCYQSQLEEHQQEHEIDLLQAKQEADSPQALCEMSTGEDSDSLGAGNKVVLSVHRTTGPASTSDFSVQCLSESQEIPEVVTLSDSD